jgi:integrase
MSTALISPASAILHRSKEELDRMGRRRHQSPVLKRSTTEGGKRDRWWFRGYVDVLESGRRNRIEKSYHVGYCSEMGKREAQAKMADLVAALNQPAAVLQSQIKFGEILTKFLANADVLPQTLEGYEGIVEKHIRPRWGDVKMCDITPEEVEMWIKATAKGLAKTTATHIRYRFTQVWKCALRWQYTKEACPMGLIPPIRNAGKKERSRKLPTKEEFHHLLDELDNYDLRAFVMVAVGTGMRAGEILAVRWGQIKGDVLKIEQSMTQRGVLGPVKTKESNRVVPIRHVEFPLRPGYASDDDRVFSLSYDQVRKGITAASRTVGIHYEGFGAHTFRRMHNTLFRRQSGDVSLAQQQLGHKDAKTNDIYYIADMFDVEKRGLVVEKMMGEVMGPVQ